MQSYRHYLQQFTANNFTHIVHKRTISICFANKLMTTALFCSHLECSINCFSVKSGLNET